MAPKFLSFALLGVTLSLAAQNLSPQVRASLDSIKPAELKGDLSFLSSDELQGRFTPSPGLDIAAQFIAAKFLAAGLEPISAKDGYFQTAEMVSRVLSQPSQAMVVKAGEKSITIDISKTRVVDAATALDLTDAPILKIAARDPALLKGLDVAGKVVLTEAVDANSLSEADRLAGYERGQEFDKAVNDGHAKLEVLLVSATHPARENRLFLAEDHPDQTSANIRVQSEELSAAFKTNESLSISFQLAAPVDKTVTVRNVVGILPGVDPLLKSTCVLVTAHYDHIGTTDTAKGLGAPASGADKIYNGANDDGSGTVSVMEIAGALSKLHPRRSIVFMTFFGEELGDLGSTYYGRHPVFPVSKTVADINLEQVGRTDSTDGPRVGTLSPTGYGYSNVIDYLAAAGKVTGIAIHKDEPASDDYFVRSDNAALAEQGVPAHTVCTAFDFSDYHAVGDEWQKIDYDNMAKVDRTIALAIWNIAESTTAPHWNAADPKTKQFRDVQLRNK